MHAGWVEFKKIVEEKTGGKMKVEIFPNQQLGGDRELTEAVQMGNVTMTCPSSAPLASFENSFYALDIPFLFHNREKVYQVLDGEVGNKLLDSLSNIQLKGLGYWENGFRNLSNSKVPITKPEDLNGLKIRTMENEIHINTWKMLGANPTPIAFGELFTALQQKTVDGQENPMELIYTNRLYEVQKYITKTQHIYSAYIVFINKDFYEGLSQDYQKIIADAVKEAGIKQRKIAEENENKAIEAMESSIEIISLTPEEQKAFKDKLALLYDKIREKAGKEIVDSFLEATK
jgi:tripartite ATP-independent transporter DctP family solute receptor